MGIRGAQLRLPCAQRHLEDGTRVAHLCHICAMYAEILARALYSCDTSVKHAPPVWHTWGTLPISSHSVWHNAVGLGKKGLPRGLWAKARMREQSNYVEPTSTQHHFQPQHIRTMCVRMCGFVSCCLSVCLSICLPVFVCVCGGKRMRRVVCLCVWGLCGV